MRRSSGRRKRRAQPAERAEQLLMRMFADGGPQARSRLASSIAATTLLIEVVKDQMLGCLNAREREILTRYMTGGEE